MIFHFIDIHHILSIHSPTDRHFAGFQVFVIMNHAMMNVPIQVFVFSFLLFTYLWVKWLGCMVVLCLTLWDPTKMFSSVAATFSFPSRNIWRFLFLHILANTCYYLSFFIIAILNGVKWYLLVAWICTYLMTKDVEYFNMLIIHLYIFFCETSVNIFAQLLLGHCLVLQL